MGERDGRRTRHVEKPSFNIQQRLMKTVKNILIVSLFSGATGTLSALCGRYSSNV